MKRLRIAIIGCGVGGPAAALFLSRAGHSVTVYERSQSLEPVGAGILISPSGQRALAKLGLIDDVLQHGSVVERLEGRTKSGRKVLDVKYRALGENLFGIGIHRGALFRVLQDAMCASGIEVRTGSEVKCVQDRFIDREGPFDLIVVSDGARSALRRSLYLETSANQYSYGAIWASVTNWGELPDNVLRQSYDGTRRMIGVLPSGSLDGGPGRLTSIFWSIPLRDLLTWSRDGIEYWKDEAAQLMPEAAPLLAQIQSPEQVTIATYYDVRTWSSVKGRCVVIGDAAHATSPQLGQGASLALMDAMTLAECIRREAGIDEALLRYRAMREKQVAFYQTASKWMTPFFQSDLSILAPPRDLLLEPLCRIGWVQRQIVATMCGFKTGIFRSQ